MNFTCPECGKDSGTSLVCRDCIPTLSAHKKQKYMQTMHQIIVERDGNQCVYCGLSAPTKDGVLCCNHNPTQASAPLKIFDTALHECTCMDCNGKHSYTAPKEKKQALDKERKSKKKPAVCSVKGCPIWASGAGYKKPDKCWRHQLLNGR